MPADIEIEVSFGATKGLPNYSSERTDQRIRLSVHSEGKELPAWLEDSAKVEDILRNHLVFGVAEALGLEASMSEAGKASLVWPVQEQLAPPAPQQQQIPQTQPQQQSGGGGQGPPKATKEEYAALPRYALNIGGRGMKMYVDQRALKTAGKYSGKAPDFKEDVKDGEGFWIFDRAGNVVLEVRQAMEAAGVQ